MQSDQDILRCPECKSVMLKPIGADPRNTAHFECDWCKHQFWNKEHPGYKDERATEILRNLRANASYGSGPEPHSGEDIILR